MKYSCPEISVYRFITEINLTSSEVPGETYADWSAKQVSKMLIEKKFSEVNEIAKYKF